MKSVGSLLLKADARRLDFLPDGCVQCVVTSPPFFGLRDYGTATWDGGDPGCDHIGVRRPGENDKQFSNAGTSRDKPTDHCRKCGARRVDRQLGLEPSPDEFVAGMVAVFRGVKRVMREDATLWLNLGSSYAGGGRGNYCSDQSKHATNVGANILPVAMPDGDCPFALRDDLTPDELVYVLAELASHLRQGEEVPPPDFAVGVDPTVASLARREEV